MKLLLTPSFHSIFFALLASLFLSGCNDEKAAETKKESSVPVKSDNNEGWVSLFNGKDLSQWRNFKKEGVSEKWQVKDGVFTLTEKGGGDIITKEQFDSFELVLEYRISKAGNSGLMYHVTEEEQTPWRTGPEIQIQDNVDGHDPQKAGWLYQLYPSEVDATNPVGEWNELRIVISPTTCVHWMNGTKYCEYVKGSKEWDEKVAKSKFSKFAKFGKATKGHICLQDHGNVVSFRNVKIRDLGKTKKGSAGN